MAEPDLPAKRLKTENHEYDFFHDFLHDQKNAALIRMLRILIQGLSFGKASSMAFLRVEEANATSPAYFNKATVDAKMIRDESGTVVVVPIVLFFMRGFRILVQFFDETAPKVPKDILQRRALHELLQFLIKDQSVFLEDKPESEPLLALRFAQHLMISLVPQKTFVIDAYYQYLKSSLNQCCSDEHPIDGQVGDTTFGVARGWHGRTDIMITGKSVPITVVETAKDSDTGSIHSDSSVEVKNRNNFTSSDHSQMLAQTVVFSFLQNKLNASGSESSLVPGIGICADKLLIFLYDCNEDLLLQSMQMKLFITQGVGVLNCHAIVILWLVLNYGMFCSGIPDKYKQYKAKFHDCLGPDYLQVYMKEVTKPLHTKPSETRSQLLDFEFEESVSDVNVWTLFPQTSEESILLEEAMKQRSLSEVENVQ